MKLGPHIRPMESPQATRALAQACGYGAFQTGWGNMQSLTVGSTLLGVPIDEFPRDYDLKTGPIWVIHSAYIAHCTPKDHRLAFGTANYLKSLFRVARAVGATFIVIHTGGTKGKAPEEVTTGIRTFLTKYGIEDFLREINDSFPLTLAVENVAAAYSFNQDLNHTLDAIEGLHHVGWCLDLAHRHAAGVPDTNLDRVISRRPPTLCHSNYPGSLFGCGLDRHGWRYKAMVGEFSMDTSRIAYWDSIVQRLDGLGVPLILEGSSSDGDMSQEVHAFTKLLTRTETLPSTGDIYEPITPVGNP